MSLITAKQVLKQIKADLIGKDSYRGVTLTYTWLANQFGHISLGFIPTFILFLAFAKKEDTARASFCAALIISAAWLIFETYNFLGPLLFQKRTKSKLLFVPDSGYTFQPDWKNIAFDTITDLSFFWFGAFSASLLCFYTQPKLCILLGIVLLLIYPSKYWYLTKMYLQIPEYPYQLRLAQWDLKIADVDKKTVVEFLNSAENFHLFVFGAKRCGKTSLSVSIATELSIKHRSAIYTTAIKLYTMFFEDKEQLLQDSGNFWTWRDCEILVIDDINPGDPIKQDLVNPAIFKGYIDTFSKNEVNRKAIKRLKVIWVMGSEDPDNQILSDWTNMLTSIGVEDKKILSINLPPNK
ncbi:MAG TPA: hypothetical protein VNX40_15215 [Mucilaginibacter sp.]|jgi:hypothetical protein|nr:hypothetical protein [Mucilaginibacter sp.]